MKVQVVGSQYRTERDLYLQQAFERFARTFFQLRIALFEILRSIPVAHGRSRYATVSYAAASVLTQG